MGFKEGDPLVRKLIEDARREGRVIGERAAAGPPAATPAKVRRRGPALVEPSFAATAAGPVWVVPLETANESNGRDWKSRSRRSGAAWRAVRAAVELRHLAPFERLLRSGSPVRVRLVRLGGRHLDRLVNLPGALKGCEDALAYLLGVDDGSPLWVPECDQEPGGPVGVRIEITAEERP